MTKESLKVAFFVWTASLGKILTTDDLRKCQIIIIDWCHMCKNSGETVDHLLLHCKVARSLWNNLVNRVGLAWAMPGKVEILYQAPE